MEGPDVAKQKDITLHLSSIECQNFTFVDAIQKILTKIDLLLCNLS